MRDNVNNWPNNTIKTKTINNTARAIQSKQYNQRYGESNQSNLINNTAKAIQSKQYGQQYNHDKPGDGYNVEVEK